MRSFLHSRLSPFQNLNFTLFFLTRTLSLVGRWSHELARAWIIIELTGSSKSQGMVFFASALAVAIFVLRGGGLVDKGDAKKIMLVTQFSMGVLVLCLALFCEWGNVQVWHLVIFSFIEGVIVSFDSPTFLAVVARLVDREDFQQAMSLNSTNFHIGRMLGPVLAGALLSLWGPSLVFAFDAFGFFIVFLGLLFVKVKPVPKRVESLNKNKSLSYFLKDKKLRYQLGQMYISVLTIFPMFVTVLRTFAVEKFSLNAEDFGRLFMFPALGSVMGALVFTIWKPKRPISAIKWGVPFVYLFYFFMDKAPTVFLTGMVMSLAGFFSYLMFAAITVGLQLDVKEEYRGRVSALVSLAFGCVGPVASFPVGIFADSFGEAKAMQFCATVFFIVSVLWMLAHRDLFKRVKL